MAKDYRPYDLTWAAAPGGEPSETHLSDPFQMKDGQMLRVMGDPFAPDIPHPYTAAVYGVMAACPRHTFQVVTDHPERAAKFLGGYESDYNAREDCSVMAMQHLDLDEPPGDEYDETWPLPHVWLGTRASDQSDADARIPPLLECPAAARFVELSPLTGAVDLRRYLPHEFQAGDPEYGWERQCEAVAPDGKRHCGYFPEDHPRPRTDWIISAGDTSPEAEPCDIDWLRAIRDQCEAAGVPCYIQQLGSKPAMNECGADGSERLVPLSPDGWGDAYDHPHGADPSEWPEGLRVREMPEESS